jgi:uncharacterized protein with GYD domain
MAGYICLMKWTQQGAASIKESPQRISQGKALAEKLGMQVVGVWVTMGQYDMIGIVDSPNEEAISQWALTLSGMGNITTQSMRALSEGEFAQIVSKLP